MKKYFKPELEKIIFSQNEIIMQSTGLEYGEEIDNGSFWN